LILYGKDLILYGKSSQCQIDQYQIGALEVSFSIVKQNLSLSSLVNVALQNIGFLQWCTDWETFVAEYIMCFQTRQKHLQLNISSCMELDLRSSLSFLLVFARTVNQHNLFWSFCYARFILD